MYPPLRIFGTNRCYHIWKQFIRPVVDLPATVTVSWARPQRDWQAGRTDRLLELSGAVEVGQGRPAAERGREAKRSPTATLDAPGGGVEMMEWAGPLGRPTCAVPPSVAQPEAIHSVYSSCLAEYTEWPMLHAVARRRCLPASGDQPVLQLGH
jgi:hypothetical protein